jgi:predicted anti-sigma-YlaC factor YlaD
MIGGRPGDDAKTADTLDKADLREAYEHGRRDERARRRRHPIGMTITFALALVGVVLLGLAVINGSFGRAGQVVDQSLSIAADQAAPTAAQAAANAGQSIRDAAQTARAKASDVRG